MYPTMKILKRDGNKIKCTKRVLWVLFQKSFKGDSKISKISLHKYKKLPKALKLYTWLFVKMSGSRNAPICRLRNNTVMETFVCRVVKKERWARGQLIAWRCARASTPRCSYKRSLISTKPVVEGCVSFERYLWQNMLDNYSDEYHKVVFEHFCDD